MSERTAIVTGGLRGLGLAMAQGLAETGWSVVAVGHIATDVPDFETAMNNAGASGRSCAIVADLRRASAIDDIFAAVAAIGRPLGAIINNAGLTFTFTDPERFIRDRALRFWEIGEAVSGPVLETNYLAAERMARRAVPLLLEAGWGRIVNVTTKIDTMNAIGTTPYGPSKAALEMASEVWARELAGSGVTVNILNPGLGADTPGMSAVVRERNRRGEAHLVDPAAMVAPLRFLLSSEADAVTGWRFDAHVFDDTLPPAEAAFRCGRPAGLTLHDRPDHWPFAPANS